MSVMSAFATNFESQSNQWHALVPCDSLGQQEHAPLLRAHADGSEPVQQWEWQFPMLYFAPDRFTALLEMRALILASGFGRPLRIRAASSYAVVLVKLLLNSIIDFSDARQRALISTSVQELTGDWRTYGHHPSSGHVSTVRSNLAAAHTQALGQALYLSRPDIEGFLASSAVRPTVSNLIVFPDRLLIDQRRLSIQSRSDDSLP